MALSQQNNKNRVASDAFSSCMGCIRLCLCRDLGPPGPGPLFLSLCPALSPLLFLSRVPDPVPALRSPLLAQRGNLSSDEGDSAG